MFNICRYCIFTWYGRISIQSTEHKWHRHSVAFMWGHYWSWSETRLSLECQCSNFAIRYCVKGHKNLGVYVSSLNFVPELRILRLLVIFTEHIWILYPQVLFTPKVYEPPGISANNTTEEAYMSRQWRGTECWYWGKLSYIVVLTHIARYLDFYCDVPTNKMNIQLLGGSKIGMI